MRKNEYAASIIQEDTDKCFICGRRGVKLDRHEPFGGGLRQKSKRLGMWVALCHEPCHMHLAHGEGIIARGLRQQAEAAARATYGWTKEKFIEEFYKSELEE